MICQLANLSLLLLLKTQNFAEQWRIYESAVSAAADRAPVSQGPQNKSGPHRKRKSRTSALETSLNV